MSFCLLVTSPGKKRPAEKLQLVESPSRNQAGLGMYLKGPRYFRPDPEVGVLWLSVGYGFSFSLNSHSKEPKEIPGMLSKEHARTGFDSQAPKQSPGSSMLGIDLYCRSI